MKVLSGIVACMLAAAALLAEEKEPSADETAIRKVLSDQVTAWNKGNLPGFMAGYWRSEDLTFYSGKDKRQGWDETFERYKKRYQAEGKEMGTLAFSELDIQLLNPEFAIVKGRWSLEMKEEELGGLFTLVMRNFDNGWVIVHDHTSA